MTNPRVLCLATALLLSHSTLAWADPPPESLEIDFSGTAAVWNPFDGFTACESFMGASLCLSLAEVICDGKGGCTGDATWEFSGAVSGELTGTFTSKAKCGPPKKIWGDVCKAQITSCDTSGTVDGFPVEISGCKIKGPVSALGEFAGVGKVKVCIEDQPGKSTCANAPGTFPYDVNLPVAWTLSLDLLQDGANYSGTATDTLGFDYSVKGKYSEKSDTAKFALKGNKENRSRGAKIKIDDLSVKGAAVTGASAKISVQGNKTSTSFD